MLIEKLNRLGKKYDKGEVEGRHEVIFNIKDSGDQMYDKDETSEEGYKGNVNRETDS